MTTASANETTTAAALRARARAFEVLAGEHAGDLASFIEAVAAVLRRRGKLVLAGNGGSAAECQHFAAELVVRYRVNRRALPAIALTTDTSTLTACGNDFSFDDIFSRQIEAIGAKGDGLVLLSTSGQSANLLRAADTANRLGLEVFGLLGKGGGPLAQLCRHLFVVPGDDTAVTQEVQLAVIHLICDVIDAWAMDCHA